MRLNFGLRLVLVLMSAACLGFAGGCSDDSSPQPDAYVQDGMVVDGGLDAEVDIDADVDVDGGGTSTASPPAEILQTGSNGYLLRGVVLAPDEVIDPGEVLISGNVITCVAEDCTTASGADEATWIDTKGIISPGLIDSHNHIAYNFLPEWIPDPPQTFQNRYQWADDPRYEEHILPYAANRSSNTHFCPGAKWGALRSLIHATTTMQGQPSGQGSCINWSIREVNRYHGLGHDHMRGTIASPRNLTDADADNLMDSFTREENPTTRYHVHMAEGYEENYILDEFDSFAGRDPRDNRHQGLSLLFEGTSILIHSIPLTEEQLQEVVDTDSKIVWSPSSNFALYGYGVTAPIQRILELGITTGIGPDWTVSGEDEMLAELRFCLDYGRAEGINELTPRRLWEMSTYEGALVLGVDAHIGRLEVGYRADVAVFGRTGDDHYEALVESRAPDVRLVFIDGLGWYGDADLEEVTARNTYCETFGVCGTEKFICVQDSPTADNRRDETMEDIRTQLYDILEGIGYPPEEQYGRGDELLELVNCEI